MRVAQMIYIVTTANMDLNLTITNKCNMRCEYCYANKNKQSADINTLYKAVDFFSNSDLKSFSLIGGEPLCEAENTIKIIEYIRKNNEDVPIYITTNGTLLTYDIAKFFKMNKVKLFLSFDGFADVEQRRYVDGSSARNDILSAIEMLVNSGVDFGVRLTLTRKNYKGCAKGVEFLVKKNIKNIIINMDWTYDNQWSDNELDGVIREYVQIYSFHNDKDGIFIRPLDGWKESIFGDRCVVPCQFGTSKLIAGCDGKIYACTMFNENKDYEIGSVLNCVICGYKTNKIEELSECKDCIARKICKKNYCACTNFQLTGDIRKKSSVLCNYYQKVGQMLRKLLVG